MMPRLFSKKLSLLNSSRYKTSTRPGRASPVTAAAVVVDEPQPMIKNVVARVSNVNFNLFIINPLIFIHSLLVSLHHHKSLIHG